MDSQNFTVAMQRDAARYLGVSEEEYLRNEISHDVATFISLLPQGKILNFGENFKFVKSSEGYEVNEVPGDLEKLDFYPRSFTGIWAYDSLPDVSSEEIRPALSKLKTLLTPSGLFYVGVVRRDSEGRYEDNGLHEAFAQDFDILRHSMVGAGKDTYFSYLARRKDQRRF